MAVIFHIITISIAIFPFILVSLGPGPDFRQILLPALALPPRWGNTRRNSKHEKIFLFPFHEWTYFSQFFLFFSFAMLKMRLASSVAYLRGLGGGSANGTAVVLWKRSLVATRSLASCYIELMMGNSAHFWCRPHAPGNQHILWGQGCPFLNLVLVIS